MVWLTKREYYSFSFFIVVCVVVQKWTDLCFFFSSSSVSIFLKCLTHSLPLSYVFPPLSFYLMQGHAACIEYVRRFGKPVMLLGGGGYTPRNVARCWTYETSIVVGGDELDNDLPFNDYYEYFAPGYKLHLPTQKNLPNANGAAYLEETKRIALETLSQLEACPSVPIFTGQEGTTQIPRAGQDLDGRSSIRRDAYDPDSRVTGAMMGRREARGEYSSTKNNSAQLKEAALGWKTAPEGEPEEEGL